MFEKIRSDFTGIEYDPSACVRIVNMRQLAAYMLHGVKLIDLYASRDFESGDPIMVGIVSKRDSADAYTKWLNYDLK